MAFLYLVAGVVIGFLAGWLLRARRAADTQPTTSSATPVTEDSDTADLPVTAKAAEPAAVAEPVSETVAASETVAVAEPVADPEPVAVAEAVADPEPETKPIAEPVAVAAGPVTTEPLTARLVADEPQADEPQAAEPEAAPATTAGIPASISDPELEPLALEEPHPVVPEEPVAFEPAAFEPAASGPVETQAAVPGLGESDEVAAVPAPVAVAIAEPDDLTKIVGIGPKMAMALAASGISTFRQVADADVATLRTAVSAAGLRLAPSLPLWPERAKQMIDTTN